MGLQTLWGWIREPEHVGRTWHSWQPDLTPYHAAHGTLDVPFVVAGWHPQTEPRAGAKRRMLGELAAQVDAYLDRCEDAARQSARVAPTPVKTAEEAQFDWFVAHQVKGQTLSAIGQDADIDRTAVARAVREVGELLDGPGYQEWKRPVAKGGRPPKPR
jgi:hypothetical protein